MPRKRGRVEHWWLIALPVLAFLAVFFVYPSATILFRTFTKFDPPQTGGLDNLVWFFSRDANRTILVRTFLVAGLSTILTSLLAFPYAYLMTRVQPSVRTLMLGIVLVSMFFGILLRNFAWVVLLQVQGPLNDVIEMLGFERQRFLGTMPAVLMGMTHVLFPYMVLPLYAVLRGIDTRLVLAAESLGATPRRAFWQIYIPLSLPGFFAGALLVFVLALGFFITPAVLGSPQQSLISQLMYAQFYRQAAFGRAGAMAIVLLAATVLVLLLARALSRRSRAYEAAP
ncbi:ABC transporter permease [Starkeya sp. ORNL1]|uniref:ABC transporter permease n=1 Tax=Starkeya sp. ORNL1 TaxID=2709380 RepID=UPI00146289BE|nr:ABC transporter permease [Starkeya sp. ORNL1]QJP14807.1 ABC transporter permease [Starkeya sp. ORNL1]